MLFSATKPSSCFRGAGPSPRSNHVAALYDDRILLIFGGESKSKTLNDVHALDFETVCSIRFLQLFFLVDLLLKESSNPEGNVCTSLKWKLMGSLDSQFCSMVFV